MSNQERQPKLEDRFAEFEQALYEDFKNELNLHPIKFSSEDARIIKGRIL